MMLPSDFRSRNSLTTSSLFAHVIKHDVLKAAPLYDQRAREGTQLRLVHGMNSVLGLRNLLSRFVKNGSNSIACLNEILCVGKFQRQDTPRNETRRSFELCKRALSKPLVLRLPYRFNLLSVETDTCDLQFGGMLLQEQVDESNKPSEFFSHLLTAAERDYGTTECESSTIILLSLILRSYFELQYITLVTY